MQASQAAYEGSIPFTRSSPSSLLKRNHVRAAQRHRARLQRLVAQIRITRIQDVVESNDRLEVAPG